MKIGGRIKIINFTIILTSLITLSSCCVFVKDSQETHNSPSETIVCFIDAIQQGDYQAVGSYLTDESIESFYRMLSSLGDLEEALESDPDFMNFIDEIGLNKEDVLDMSNADIIGLVFISTAYEDPDLFDYEILGEEIYGDSAVVYFKTDSEVEIPLVKENNRWKISFELW